MAIGEGDCLEHLPTGLGVRNLGKIGLEKFIEKVSANMYIKHLWFRFENILVFD